MPDLPPVGGTTAAAIIGSERDTPFDAYLKLTGEVERDEFTPTYRMRRGLALEELLGAEYERMTGYTVELPQHVIYSHRYPWITGHVDGLVRGRSIGIDLKTAGWDQAYKWGDPGTDHIPPDYFIQMCWYMAGLEYDQWDICAEIGGNDPVIYTIHRDIELENMFIAKVYQFLMEHVIPRNPPPLGGSSLADAWLKKTYPGGTEPHRAVDDPEFEALVREWDREKKECNRLTKRFKDKELDMRAFIGSHMGIDLPNGDSVTYTSDIRGVRSLRSKIRNTEEITQ